MKRLLFLVLIISGSLNSFAQNSPKQHEVGLSFYGLHGFGITYRVGTPTALWRFNGLSISGQNQKNEIPPYSSYKFDRISNSIGLEVGREYRKPLNERLDFRYGADVTLNYMRSRSEEIYSTTPDPAIYKYKNSALTPGVDFVVGVNYKINSFLLVGAELTPGVGYSFTKSERTLNEQVDNFKGHNFSYSLNNSARITLVCKF